MTSRDKIYIRSYLITEVEGDNNVNGKWYSIKFVFKNNKGEEDFREVTARLTAKERKEVDQALYDLIILNQNHDFVPFEQILKYIMPFTQRK